MPRPPVDLTDHLAVLARQVGYDIDLDELDPVIGHEPRLVTGWAAHAGRHAALAYARWLLDGPETFLRESPGDGHDTIAALLLPDVDATARRLDTQLTYTTSLFAHGCRTVAGTGLGLLWPRAAAAGTVRPDPGEHRDVTHALAAAGFTAGHRTQVWARTTAGGRATVTIDGTVRLHVHPRAGPPWQATFAMSTPAAAILAAAAASG